MVRTTPPGSVTATGWVKFSSEKVDVARASGKSLFLAFTADWCMDCQMNDEILAVDAVNEVFDECRVLRMRADWTQRDAKIEQAVVALGRRTVPLYVIVPADRGRPAVVLGTNLTTEYVVDALRHVLGRPPR